MDDAATRRAGIGNRVRSEGIQLQELASRYAQACRTGASTELAHFLPPEGDPNRRPALYELIKTDFALRWQKGETVGLEQYLDQYPELGESHLLPARLILEEYLVRQQYGDRPELATYQFRFPDQFAELQRLEEEETIRNGLRAPTAAAPQSSAASIATANTAGSLAVLASGGDTTLVPGGGFKPIKRIGTGGFGEVWKAEAPGGVPVALKIIFRTMDHEDSQRELEALELIKRLQHPFLMPTHQFFSTEDRLIIVLELADGSLRDRVKECRQKGLPGIPLEELVTYFRETAEALDYLHGEQVIHRDIKPENILILKRHAKLADFGLARVLQSKRVGTATGSGTPPYMAPEIWMGQVSQHSDQYSLACAYAELRLNRRIHKSKDLREMMLDHLERQPDLEGIGAAEQTVILKALAKKPDERYASCREFMGELGQALAGELRHDLPPASFGSRASSPSLANAPTANLDTQRPPGQRIDTSATQPEQQVWRPGEPRPAWTRRAIIAAVVVSPLAALAIWYFNREPLPTAGPFLPAGCEAAAGATLRNLTGSVTPLYDRIDRKLPDDTRISFLLIERTSDSDPPPFYVMENKVSNDLFRKFMTDARSAELFTQFREKTPWAIKNEWEKGGKKGGFDGMDGGAGANLPVLRVTVVEAFCFAQWLGGNLPTALQWDKAGGRYDGAAGPFVAPFSPGQIAIGRRAEGPMPVGTASGDVSKFGCRDLAGNGQEWTRDLYNVSDSSRKVPVFDIPEQQETTEENRKWSVITRGQNYDHLEPFTFDSANLIRQEVYGYSSPYVGFRVVIEIPSSR